MLLTSLALAAPLRLILVGDTGLDTDIARRVAEAVRTEAAADGVHVLAMGDLFYDAPPVGPDCVAKVVERYNAFYAGIPADKMIGVLGNHDVADPTETHYSAEARACTVAAFAQLGWTDPSSHVVALDAGKITVDLAVIDAGLLNGDGVHEGATAPTLTLRKKVSWRLYSDHYTWLTSTGKCKEAGNTWAWLGKPQTDLWLNGHAHHLEAIPVEGALAVTSGAGMQFRPNAPCAGVTGSFFVYTEGTTPQGGYLRLDLESKTTARLTPVLCDVGGACVDKPAVVCTRKKKGRGVDCAPAP